MVFAVHMSRVGSRRASTLVGSMEFTHEIGKRTAHRRLHGLVQGYGEDREHGAVN